MRIDAHTVGATGAEPASEIRPPQPLPYLTLGVPPGNKAPSSIRSLAVASEWIAAGWTRNLATLWLAVFATTVGMNFCFPSLPLFLRRELQIHDPHQLAPWTGIVASATGL